MENSNSMREMLDVVKEDGGASLHEIRDQMEDLCRQAIKIVSSSGDNMALQRSRGYWYSHIMANLGAVDAGQATFPLSEIADDLDSPASSESGNLEAAIDDWDKYQGRMSHEEAVTKAAKKHGVSEEELNAYIDTFQ